MAKAAQFENCFVGEKPNMAPSLANMALSEELRASTMSLNKRSMVLDEDRFEDQFLKCNVCKERFQNDCLPRMLPCHHSFCQKCVDNLYRMAAGQRQSYSSGIRPLSTSAVSINCPSCRANFVATDETMKRLPTDHRIVQLMDFVNHTERYTVTFCSKHTLQALNFFCEPCVRPVCRDCTVLDHKEVDGHLVMDLEEALAKYTPVLDNALTEMDAENISLEEKKVALEAVTANVEQVKTDLLDQIKSCMTRMKELLEERQKVLETKVVEEVDKEKSKLQEKAALLDERRKVLKTQSQRLRDAKEDNNVEEMFRIHQEVREYRSGPPIRVREVDDGLMTSFVLNTRDEAMLASRINNFCDITSKVETTSGRTKTTVKPYVYRSSSFR